MNATAYFTLAMVGVVILLGWAMALMNHYAHKREREEKGK